MTVIENNTEYRHNNSHPTVLSINFESGKFGASIFIDNELKILPEDENRLNRDLVDWLSLQNISLKVITSSRSNIHALKQCLPSDIIIQLLPSSEFSMVTAAELQEEYSINLSTECFPSNESCFKSLHALISFLSKMENEFELPRQVSILNLESSKVFISKSCLQALQIFNFDPHPNMHASNQSFKEGCSIFSLFSQTVSEEGRSKLKKWFQNPTNNTKILKSRLDSIEALLKTEMNPFIKNVTKSLKKCVRITNVLNDLKFKPDAIGLLKIGRFCDSFQEINIQSQDQSVINFPLIETIRSTDFTSVFNLALLIRRVIDTEACKTSEIYTIREHVSVELDELRRKYGNLPEFLTSFVSEIAQGINSREVEAVNIVYFPQLGFLITLPLPVNGADPKSLGNELGFELQFQSDKICYFKNDKMRSMNQFFQKQFFTSLLDLDESIGDVYADIIDSQLEILLQIVNEAVKCEELLKSALEICSELDCLIAMSKTAQTYGLNRPEIVSDSSILQIEDGRHLLVELYSNRQCIPNDCNLCGAHNKMIITGANSSGKSVYLKQVGIMTFLAHIGSFIPARRAKIGVIDRIVTRIKTVESIGKGESCFMIDLKQVKAICDTFTERSLILIDEFGKGTNQNDGMALFSGLISYFATRNVRLLAITHMYEIFRRQLVQGNPENHFNFFTMKVIPQEAGLCYLYKLTEGMSEEQSFAIECARDSGISEEILQRAREILNELKNGASPEDLKLLNDECININEAIEQINSIVTTK